MKVGVAEFRIDLNRLHEFFGGFVIFPFLFEREIPVRVGAPLADLGEGPLGFLEVLQAARATSPAGPEDYFALCLACHHAAVLAVVVRIEPGFNAYVSRWQTRVAVSSLFRRRKWSLLAGRHHPAGKSIQDGVARYAAGICAKSLCRCSATT